MINVSFKGPSIGKTSNGKFFVWTQDGVDFFDPKEINPNLYAPIVDIKELMVNYKLVIPGKNPILKKHISLTDTLELSYDQNVFVFEFIALHYANPIKNQYAYKLEGFDKEWIYQDFKRRFASYSNIKAGTYVFKVKAANADGVWNTQEKQIVIIIQPPFWETWWFRILAFVVSAGLIYGIIYWRVSIVQKQKRVVEEQKRIVDEQNSTLAEQNSIITNQNAEIQQQAEELMQSNEELEVKNDIISKTLNNLQVLSEFGQKLTATLNIKSINDMIYDYVCSLMPTDAFGVGLYIEHNKTISFENFRESNHIISPFSNNLHQENSLAVYCFTKQTNIFITNLENEKFKYISGALPYRTSQPPKSLIYLPIRVEDRNIGVLTVQSFVENAYTISDQNNLQSLASYLSIAFDNASVYDIVRQKNSQIEGSIRYAQTIQSAILPHQELYDRFDCFVLFMPRDVVSGDFY